MPRPPGTPSVSSCHAAAPRYDAISTGLLMIAGGVVLMLYRQGIVHWQDLIRWSPALMIIPAGRALVAHRNRRRAWLHAAAWAGASVLFLLSAHEYPVLRGEVLVALAFVAVGVWLLWRPDVKGGAR
jgi:hypothetical protein